MEKLLDSTHICKFCGEEIPNGIFNWASHECKQLAPNENIESYRYSQELKAREKKEYDKFQPVFEKMNEDERQRYITLSMCGTWDIKLNVVLMSEMSIRRLHEFKEIMYAKYTGATDKIYYKEANHGT